MALSSKCSMYRFATICLNTKYFIYDGVFYKQKKGAAMGSPVSPIVANKTRYRTSAHVFY